jgi:hypothetical protein
MEISLIIDQERMKRRTGNMGKNAWSNIVITSDDPEIKDIDNLQSSLGPIPPQVSKVRELITRFEVCHFKYRKHLEHIRESIKELRPSIDPGSIGAHHMRHGADAWKEDKTGRSRLGQRYLWALAEWLGEPPEAEDPDEELSLKVAGWLGQRDPDKEKLVRLLNARLRWDWKSYEELEKELADDELAAQACRMDVCHYLFSRNLDLLLQGIGKMRPVEAFEGCGSSNPEIRTTITKEFKALSEELKHLLSIPNPRKRDLIRAWLIACLAKTLKEQIGLQTPLEVLSG